MSEVIVLDTHIWFWLITQELERFPDQWREDALKPAAITLLPLTAEISCRAVNLSPVHKDPFDRIIIATALTYGAKLATVDGLFARYPELVPYLLPI